VGNWEVTVPLRRMWDSHREYLKFFHFSLFFSPNFYPHCFGMRKGYLALVLHAHLPFVRHPEYPEFLEEDWLLRRSPKPTCLSGKFSKDFIVTASLSG
jgi:hypothetical protein